MLLQRKAAGNLVTVVCSLHVGKAVELEGADLVALAVVLTASRVYLRVHYLADVLVGVCLGLALGLPYIVLLKI